MRLVKLGIFFLALGILVTAVLVGKMTPSQRVEAADDKATAGVKMVEAAQNLLAGLSDEHRKKATFAFDDPQRLVWHYYPITPWPRLGAVLKTMSPTEKDLFLALLRSGTSAEGYKTALEVISLENILRDIENTPWAKKYRDSTLYYVCIYGKPAMTGKWAWRIEGHHLCLNYVLEDGKITAATPMVYGANPNEVMSGPHKGMRPLAPEEDLARQLYTSLDSDSRKKATIAEVGPFDVLTEVKAQPKRLPPQGAAFADMTDGQKQLLQQLVQRYAGRHPDEVAARLLKEAADAGFELVHFGWAGPAQPGEPFYYRVQGPTFVVEFCNTQNRGNHSHSVWRSYVNDFGVPLAAK